MPNPFVNAGSRTLDEPLPEADPREAVIPPADVPLEVLVQKLVDKALDEKDKSELTFDEVHHTAPVLTPEEAEEARKADAEATDARVAEKEKENQG